jgi:hypothetical protein
MMPASLAAWAWLKDTCQSPIAIQSLLGSLLELRTGVTAKARPPRGGYTDEIDLSHASFIAVM